VDPDAVRRAMHGSFLKKTAFPMWLEIHVRLCEMVCVLAGSGSCGAHSYPYPCSYGAEDSGVVPHASGGVQHMVGPRGVLLRF